MDGWILFWKVVIIATALAFFSLAIVVMVLGIWDIYQLLEDLRMDDEKSGKGS